jgi:hypothetical protein
MRFSGGVAFDRHYTFAAGARNMPAVKLADPFPWAALENRLAVYFGIAIAMLAAGYAKRTWRHLQRSKARSWPVTEGRIELADVGGRNWWDLSADLRNGSLRSAKNVAVLGYSYYVAGIVYSGTYKKEFEAEEDAWEFARRLKGGAITVRYNANQPSVSVLCEPSIDALQQTHPPVLEHAELIQYAWQPTVESAAFRGTMSAWRIASWIALATGAWEGYRFLQLTNAHQLNLPEAKVRLVVCLAAIAVARLCRWMSVLQRRRAIQERELPHA